MANKLSENLSPIRFQFSFRHIPLLSASSIDLIKRRNTSRFGLICEGWRPSREHWERTRPNNYNERLRDHNAKQDLIGNKMIKFISEDSCDVWRL